MIDYLLDGNNQREQRCTQGPSHRAGIHTSQNPQRTAGGGSIQHVGLSPHTEETVAVKVELDSRPPEGAQFDTSIIRKHSILHLQHYDKASLLRNALEQTGWKDALPNEQNWNRPTGKLLDGYVK